MVYRESVSDLTTTNISLLKCKNLLCTVYDNLERYTCKQLKVQGNKETIDTNHPLQILNKRTAQCFLEIPGSPNHIKNIMESKENNISL